MNPPETHQFSGIDANRENGRGDVEALREMLLRMREGDRDAAAEFIDRYGALIRRRLRHKLRPPMRRLFDSLDVLSTVARRLDRVVHGRRLQATNLNELWGLVFRIAEHSILDKVRIYNRISRVEGPDGELVTRLRQGATATDADADDEIDLRIDAMLDSIATEDDRSIAALWLRGVSHGHIARHVDMTPANVRKRWQRIKEEIRRNLCTEDP